MATNLYSDDVIHGQAISYVLEKYGLEAAEDINRLRQMDELMRIFCETPTMERVAYCYRTMMHTYNYDESWFERQMAIAFAPASTYTNENENYENCENCDSLGSDDNSVDSDDRINDPDYIPEGEECDDEDYDY